MSGVPSPVSSYGSGYGSALEGLAAALKEEAGPGNFARRNTVTAAETELSAAQAQMAVEAQALRAQNRLSLGPRNPQSPKQPALSLLQQQQSKKRQSVILTSLNTSFKKLFASEKIKEVKGIFSVDTTTVAPPSLVVEEIMRVLDHERENVEEFQLKYKHKGHLFKIRYPNQHLEFTLEVCKIRKMDLTGVKSKRIKGDLWVYKDYCQRIISKLRL